MFYLFACATAGLTFAALHSLARHIRWRHENACRMAELEREGRGTRTATVNLEQSLRHETFRVAGRVEQLEAAVSDRRSMHCQQCGVAYGVSGQLYCSRCGEPLQPNPYTDAKR